MVLYSWRYIYANMSYFVFKIFSNLAFLFEQSATALSQPSFEGLN